MSHISELQLILKKFAQDRDWEQYHTSANLAKAISIESSELLENFLWDEDSLRKTGMKDRCAEEVADIFIYLLRFCDVSGIDLERATLDKININIQKYPIEKAKGNARKYMEF